MTVVLAALENHFTKTGAQPKHHHLMAIQAIVLVGPSSKSSRGAGAVCPEPAVVAVIQDAIWAEKQDVVVRMRQIASTRNLLPTRSGAVHGSKLIDLIRPSQVKPACRGTTECQIVVGLVRNSVCGRVWIQSIPAVAVILRLENRPEPVWRFYSVYEDIGPCNGRIDCIEVVGCQRNSAGGRSNSYGDHPGQPLPARGGACGGQAGGRTTSPHSIDLRPVFIAHASEKNKLTSIHRIVKVAHNVRNWRSGRGWSAGSGGRRRVTKAVGNL